MKKAKIVILTLLVGGVLLQPVGADIYSWTDPDGVRHFANAPPPPDAISVNRTQELAYDAEADARRQADEIRQSELRAQQQAAERKQALLEQQLQLAQEIRRAQETTQQALKEFQNRAAATDNAVTAVGYYPRRHSRVKNWLPADKPHGIHPQPADDPAADGLRLETTKDAGPNVRAGQSQQNSFYNRWSDRF